MYARNAYIEPEMSANTSPAATSEFETDVLQGLHQFPKKLSSKYFYDAAGSKLFQQIMALPEYYPTRTEFDILEKQKAGIISFFEPESFFHLVELGAGDGLKTKILLRELVSKNIDFEYAPVDISGSAINELQNNLKNELPALKTDGFVGEYFTALNWLKENKPGRKVVLFLGSNIGNFEEDEGLTFIKQIVKYLQPGDKILMGFDLRKDPEVIREAYDDAAGVTAAFNLNLLYRINNELGADFNLSNFSHFTDYNPLTGTVKSYLISRKKQMVHFPKQRLKIDFEAWEAIHTENSRKYTVPQIKQIGNACGLETGQLFTDEKHYFADVLFELNEAVPS